MLLVDYEIPTVDSPAAYNPSKGDVVARELLHLVVQGGRGEWGKGNYGLRRRLDFVCGSSRVNIVLRVYDCGHERFVTVRSSAWPLDAVVASLALLLPRFAGITPTIVANGLWAKVPEGFSQHQLRLPVRPEALSESTVTATADAVVDLQVTGPLGWFRRDPRRAQLVGTSWYDACYGLVGLEATLEQGVCLPAGSVPEEIGVLKMRLSCGRPASAPGVLGDMIDLGAFTRRHGLAPVDRPDEPAIYPPHSVRSREQPWWEFQFSLESAPLHSH